MALPSSGTLAIKDTAGTSRSIAREVTGGVSGDQSLTDLSVLAGKSASHAMTEFYGYDGLVTIAMTLGSLFSNPSIQYNRSVFVNDSNIGGKTTGVRIRCGVTIYRASSGTVTSGSVGSYIRQSSPTGQSVQVWLTGSTRGVRSNFFNTDVDWTSSTPQHYFYMQINSPNPATGIDSAASISINSFWGNGPAQSTGSPAGIKL